MEPNSQNNPMYCRSCGVEIPADSVYCVSCGTPLSSPPKPYDKPEGEPGYERTEPGGQQKLEDFYSGFKFPEKTVPPRIGRALTLGWDIMMQDIVGVILVALAFILLSLLSAIPILGYFIVVALQVGMIGWAEERRRGIQSGPGAMVRIALNRFTESLLLALVLIGVSLVIMLPLFIAYFGLFVSIISTALTASSSSSPSIS
ncbi:zinc ribbon domain-containing protein, partial [bacterium]|nr:zinc ribbon domain-containing protein [bacterium]